MPEPRPEPEIGLPFSPAAERNRAPILDVLSRWLPPQAAVLELASGTGQHAAHMAAAVPGWHWQPTDGDAAALPGIAARCAGQANVAAPQRLDLLADAWPHRAGGWDAIFAANLVHIAPWAVTPALMRGAAAALKPGGTLVLYGPVVVDGEALADSNAAFDASLRARDPAWGLRRLAALQAEADAAGLCWTARQPMPAHNQMLAWRRPA
jgi:SAM-dependent methyltransferase